MIKTSGIIIDRPKGSKHPRFPDLTYPLDYGYLKNTRSSDGSGIDLWRGTQENETADGIICTIDELKRDSEIKILIGCTEQEMKLIFDFHNSSRLMGAILIKREME